MFDIDINFVEDLYPKIYSDEFILSSIAEESEICKLIDALYRLYFYDNRTIKKFIKENATAEIIGQKFGDKPLFYTIKLYDWQNSCDSFLLSLDYVGPSIYWAEHIAKLEQSEIKLFFKETGKLGGRMLWPRGFGKYCERNKRVYLACAKVDLPNKFSDFIKNRYNNGVDKVNAPTINSAKAGKANFYDRFDWTLLLIKAYYKLKEKNLEEKTFDDLISEVNEDVKVKLLADDVKRFYEFFIALYLSWSWLEKFGSFEKFCDFFYLKECFVDTDYNIIELSSFLPIVPTKESYLKYIANNMLSVYRRNKLIKNRKQLVVK